MYVRGLPRDTEDRTSAGSADRAPAEQQLQLVIGHQGVQATPQRLVVPHACSACSPWAQHWALTT